MDRLLHLVAMLHSNNRFVHLKIIEECLRINDGVEGMMEVLLLNRVKPCRQKNLGKILPMAGELP